MRLSTDRLLAENVEADRKETMRARAAEREALRAERLAKGESVDDIPPIILNSAETRTTDDTPTGYVETKPECVTVRLADIIPERVEYLWDRRIAYRKMVIIAGFGGAAKTTLAMDIIARHTRGLPFPMEPQASRREPGNALILTCEDGVADTVVPRLTAAGADLSRAHALAGVRRAEDKTGHALFSIERDVRLLEDACERLNCRVVVIDPITSYLGRIDAYRDNEVRAVLGPLAEFAARRSVAIVAIMHLSKNAGQRAVDRLLGSVAFGNLSRIVHLCKNDPQDRSRVYFSCGKSNLGAMPDTLAFRLVSKETSVGPYAAIEWEPLAIRQTVDELFADARAGTGRPPIVREAAEQLLLEMLAVEPRLQSEVLRAADREGIGSRTLDEAKKRLGVVCRNIRHGGLDYKASWWWLPGKFSL